jgi:hypothetical protein
MKTRISIGLNIALVATILFILFHNALETHFYAENTGLVLREAAAQIEEGHSTRVGEILGKVNSMPTRSDLIVTLHQLNPKEAAQAGNGQPADRTQSKPEGSNQPQSEAEGRTR